MSACSEFAEHVWKPGSCKNCFHPRSAHRPNDNALQVRTGTTGNEEDGLSFSPYCKPTIAVRPTVMNPDTSDMWTDVNMNSEQDNQKTSTDRLSLKKLLEISPFGMDSNGCSKALKEAVLQGTTLGNLDYPTKFSQGAVSPPGIRKETIGSIFVAQDEGWGLHNGTRDPCEPCITQIMNSTYVTNGTYYPLRLEVKTTSVGTCNNCSDVLASPPPALDQNVSLELDGNITSTAPTKSASFRRTEPASTSSSSSITQDSALQTARTCGRASSFLSEPTSLSDSCSFESSTDSLVCSQGPDVFRHSCSESPQTFVFPSSPCADVGNRQSSAEPIYAESTKRKRRPLGDRPAPPSPDHEAEPAGEAQRAKITVMATHAENNNRKFYLSSPDSAVSTQLPHFSPNSNKDPSSPAFKWPSACGSTDLAVASSVQPKPQASPPIPPKRCSRSPKLGTSSLSSLVHAEMQPEACINAHPPSPTLVQDKPQGDGLSCAPVFTCSERRQKLYNSHWNWKTRIEEEEEDGGEEAVPPGGTLGLINGTAVLRPEDWGTAAPGRETSPPGTANNGASQQREGSVSECDRLDGNMLTQAVSSTRELSEGPKESHDPTPPPPPPKKHHRSSGKMSQSSLELERASQQGSIESLSQSLRALSGSLATASSDSLHCDSRVFSDGGIQDSSHAGSPSPFPSSPLTSSPVSPNPDPFPSMGLDQTQPPPLPVKNLLSRTVSAPSGPSGKFAQRGRPCLPFGGSEDNISRPEQSQSGHSCSPADSHNQYSSNESLERFHAHLDRSLRSRTLDETPARGRSRLGGCLRGRATSSSSPQLSGPLPSPSAGSSLHLQSLLSNIDSREGVYSKLGGLYAESLRRLALKCEEHFTRSQRNPLHFDESNWSLFKLTCNKPCCDAGDAVYYSASCASDPSNSYAVKICKSQTAEGKQGDVYGLSVQKSMPSHFNVQQDCGHFIACVPQSMLPPNKATGPPGQQGEQERVVVITREVPQQTAADFVRDWAAFHRSQPEVYERRVCFLLLQLCNGLEHLKEHGVTHRDLCLENLLLVSGRRGQSEIRDQTHLPRLLVGSFGKAKQRGVEDATADPRLRRDHARLAPEIVSAAQYRKFDEFQVGILIYELLHQPNPFEVCPGLKEQDYCCEQLPPIPVASIYSPGLQQLARLLLQPDPIKRIHIQEARRALQCLLWGPRQDLMEQQWERPGGPPRHEGLLNWLDVKRALLMMKFAERSLEAERNAELEDWLCCQYFSAAHPLALCHTAEQLYCLK
ncbi:inactive tyrosine-protein kinase PRAG1 [Scleropages formosus]|uniref:PEAK1 related, kinase-activating pseudokinase 1 n=1 Tax=Scleropages formosus TaxID=113540 RepID=A0A8C9SEN0_SCLFO|nr:inactive tyrosine-protein kinase PRAG1 [Scleropages formosus]